MHFSTQQVDLQKFGSNKWLQLWPTSRRFWNSSESPILASVFSILEQIDARSKVYANRQTTMALFALHQHSAMFTWL